MQRAFAPIGAQLAPTVLRFRGVPLLLPHIELLVLRPRREQPVRFRQRTFASSCARARLYPAATNEDNQMAVPLSAPFESRNVAACLKKLRLKMKGGRISACLQACVKMHVSMCYFLKVLI